MYILTLSSFYIQNVKFKIRIEIAILIIHFNCPFYLFPGSLKEKCVPFLLDNVQIGMVTPEVVEKMTKYQNIFIIAKDLLTNEVKFVTMALTLTDRKTRSQKMACELRDWKDRDYFPVLKGWRNEVNIVHCFYKKII